MWVPPLTQTNLEERYRELTNANFNLVIGSWNTSPTQQLAICERVGLKCLPGPISPSSTLPDNSATWGYFIVDEPSASAFPSLAERVQEIRTNRPGHLGYINLLPNYATPAQMGAATYQEYVDQFIQVVQPDVLSMDHYPLMRPEADSRAAYCANLESMRLASQKAGIPFWNYFYCMPFNDRLDPTEAQIRWQIYAALAYGAKGVMYFCYWTPGEGGAGTGEFPKGGAIITAEGFRTRHYEEARRINAELKQIGPTLMKLNSTGTWWADTSTNSVPPGGCGLKSLTRISGDPPSVLLAGTFRHEDGRRALLLLNHNYSYTAWPTLDFDVPITGIMEVDKRDGTITPVRDDSPELSGFQVSLGPGDGRLFLLPGQPPARPFINIVSIEQWDGIQNPHAAEGVTLSGTGTDADPAIYTIPRDLSIGTTGGITLSPRPPAGVQDGGPDNTIILKFTGANLEMSSGGFINVARRTRNGAKRAVLSMGGGDILGTGRIDGLWDGISTPRVLTITNARNVGLTSIDLHVENVNNGGRHLNIFASGHVQVGAIDNSDRDTGGNDAGDVSITAGAVTVGSVNTAAARVSSAAKNGNVRLSALGPPAYDPENRTLNSAYDRLVVTGSICTAGGSGNIAGDVTLTAVIVELGSDFHIQLPGTAAFSVEAGVYPNGVGAVPGDLFINHSATPVSTAFVVQWSGALAPSVSLLRAGSNVILDWNWAGYVLQENSVLTNPFGWSNLSDHGRIIRPLDAPQKFYRLKQ